MLRLVVALIACLSPVFGLPQEAAKPPTAILLVASRQLEDANFRESVVLVTRHGGGGAPLGIIVNRPMPVPLSEVFKDLDHPSLKEEKLHFGGPVARRTLFFVFRTDKPPAGAVEVLHGLYMSLSRQLLQQLLKRDRPVEGLRVFAGYAGWAPGQLEHEVARGDWHLSPADASLLFDLPAERLWPELLRRASGRKVRSTQPPVELLG